jgi:uncharacterized membrane protein (UPF0127 family)
MLHGNPGRTLVAAGLALAVCLFACRTGQAGTEAGETGAPGRGAAYPYRPEEAARAFAEAGRAVVKLPSGRSIVAEIADTPEREMYGYMYRHEVKDTEGMVFVYPEAGLHPFWMKNTLVPLDIIWMDDAFKVLHVETAPPCKSDPCPSYGTPRMSRYTLELKAGAAAREGLHVGDTIQVAFPGDGTAR